MIDILTKQKLAIAKLLPGRIEKSPLYEDTFNWLSPSWPLHGQQVRDTEWLQICQWVEEGLTDEQSYTYRTKLWEITGQSTCFGEGANRDYQQASVQQRLAALEAAGIINTTKE